MSRRPINPPVYVTMSFGVTTSSSYFGKHTGVDYGEEVGTPVYAPAAGVVTAATGDLPYNGRIVQIREAKGARFYHRMMHNSKIVVSVGQAVREGQLLAYSGNSDGGTGNNTGAHVHWDICTVKTPSSFSQFKDPAVWLTYPRTVYVKVALLRVRSRATTEAPLSGSKLLPFATPVRVHWKVKGQSVEGNPYWFITSGGNYIWSGGVR